MFCVSSITKNKVITQFLNCYLMYEVGVEKLFNFETFFEIFFLQVCEN